VAANVNTVIANEVKQSMGCIFNSGQVDCRVGLCPPRNDELFFGVMPAYARASGEFCALYNRIPARKREWQKGGLPRRASPSSQWQWRVACVPYKRYFFPSDI